MPVVEANGVRFHTQQLGAGGPPVVMLHGLLIGTLASWYFAIAPRLAASRRVLLYDLRGHGLSERPPSGYGLAPMAADLACLIDGFADRPVSLVGHSYGAVVALRYAVEHPENVSRLVLVEAPLPVLTPGALSYFTSQSVDDLIRLLPEQQQTVLQRDGKRQRGRIENQIVGLAMETTMSADLLADSDIADEAIASYEGPVLLCYGTSSSFARVSCERLKRLLPNARLELIEGGHFLPYEAPGALADAIDSFLDG